MRISRRFKRIVSAMLATALAFTMTFSTDVMPLADSKQDQLKARSPPSRLSWTRSTPR